MEKFKETSKEAREMVPKPTKGNTSMRPKRKRASAEENLSGTDKEVSIARYQRELDDLFLFFKELSGSKVELRDEIVLTKKALIACLLEESSLPYSKLVDEIHEKLKEGFTKAYVSSVIHAIGQRVMYGIGDANIDVVKDESESCLWCWETRDVKLFDPSQRGILHSRRVGRKRIQERVSVLSEILSALSVPENEDNKNKIMKLSAKLRKTSDVEGIRSLVEKQNQRNNNDMGDKVGKQKGKELIKESERYKLIVEKEKQKKEREFQKEKLQHEKELKRQQEEADKEMRRQEKEAAEEKKLLKKKQEEAEREKRQREKEEAESKRKRSLQKQASIMERFLKTKRSDSYPDIIGSEENQTSGKFSEVEVGSAATSYMDTEFSREEIPDMEELRKLHLKAWHKLFRYHRSCHWGVRHNLKTELFKELKLHGSSPVTKPLEKVGTAQKGVVSCKADCENEQSFGNLLDVLEESLTVDALDTGPPSTQLCRKKLLQFDKSNRPAYYGVCRKRSDVVGPRQPFKKDPNLNYDIDSDEEWEEEEPGESLFDCDKDAEDELLEEEDLKADEEEESDNGFIVPDGYLSETEGVQVDNSSDKIECEPDADTWRSCTVEIDSEEIRALMQNIKHLGTLTEKALKKGHPWVISNLMHEKFEVATAADTSNTNKIEHICLRALCMTACGRDCVVEQSVIDNSSTVDLEVPLLCSTPNPAAVVNTTDADLAEFVSSIRSNSQSINKVVDSLRCKFPSTPKTQLGKRVREISDYVDNCWQVKKEVLNKLGWSNSPANVSKPKGIPAFFSKLHTPPRDKIVISESPKQHTESGDCHGG